MVARRDVPVIGQGDHLSQVPNGRDDRCIKPQLGQLVATLQLLRQASPRGMRLLATIGGGHEPRCPRALRCQCDSQGQPRTLSQPSRALVEIDNKVTQAYIDHPGGRSLFLNSIAQDLWSMCYLAQILLVAVHRPGKVNVRAHRLSRWKQDQSDIRLSPAVFLAKSTNGTAHTR